MNNPCYHLTGYGSKIQVVFLQTKIRTLVKILFKLLLSIWRGGGEEIQNDIIKYKL